MYVPTLSNLVYEHPELGLNFLGFAVGDPCTDDTTQTITGELNFGLEYAMKNSFISSETYSYISSHCVKHDPRGMIVPDESSPACKSAWRLYYIATSAGDGNGPPAKMAHFISPYNSWGPNNNRWWNMMATYLAQDDVMKALHVESYPVRPWSLFADHLDYTIQYKACFYDSASPDAKPYYDYSMIPFYQKLAGKLRNIIVFNGDTDPCLQVRGTEAAVDAMGLKMVEGGDWRPWFFQPDATSIQVLEDKSPYWGPFLSYRSMDPQLGGYVKNFEKNLSFVTVHTSGHMVPQYKPVAALHMFKRGLASMMLSPLLNETAINDASDASFFGSDTEAGYLGEWVRVAQSPAYLRDAAHAEETQK